MGTPARKADHLRIAAGDGVVHRASTGLEDVHLRHRALPPRELEDVDLSTELLGSRLDAPLIVSAMTGGTPAAIDVNDRLAHAAAGLGVGMVLGSGRALLDDPSLLRTYRGPTRPPLLLANLGAAALTPWDAERVVEMVGADGLCVHLNPIQEAIQPEGDTRFGGALERIAACVETLAPRPVVVKEVGFGMDPRDVVAVRRAGVAAVDVAGAGGTNWALVEGRRDRDAGRVAAAFADWGVPTARAVSGAVAAAPGLPVIASGGVRDGVEAAKCLALGAVACGLARPLLVAARAGRAREALAAVVRQLRIAVWATGAPSARALDASALR
ncbi:MAG TPA: type 2 isopentenyl-diphosphate Delta-isomerase [Solirubrobacteraceae bacterium]|nr:type 2 isopentenyl-diphosphate Delta-isomerase [Solirubrobacteraceae bacterium]